MSESGMIYSVEETLRIQTVKLNQQLNKLLEQNTQIIELTAERDKALAQNDELAATAEALREHAVDAAGALGFLSHHLRGRMGEAALMDMAEKADALNEALKVTPQHHLRDVQAEAGRAGFIAGYSQAQSDPFTANDTEIDLYADEYAASVMVGEK